MNNNRKIFMCECGTLTHMLALYNHEEDFLDVTIVGNPRARFFERLKDGIKFIFGGSDVVFSDLCLYKEKITELRDALNEWLEKHDASSAE